jgi:hypothetical protein
MVKHKIFGNKFFPIFIAFLVGGLLFSIAIGVAYKLGSDRSTRQSNQLSTMLDSVNATPAANLKSEAPSIAKTPGVATNTAPVKNSDQILKECLTKIEVFKTSALKMGYSQSEIDGLVPMAEYNCYHPDNKFNLSGDNSGQNLSGQIQQTADELNQLNQKVNEMKSGFDYNCIISGGVPSGGMCL